LLLGSCSEEGRERHQLLKVLMHQGRKEGTTTTTTTTIHEPIKQRRSEYA